MFELLTRLCSEYAYESTKLISSSDSNCYLGRRGSFLGKGNAKRSRQIKSKELLSFNPWSLLDFVARFTKIVYLYFKFDTIIYEHAYWVTFLTLPNKLIDWHDKLICYMYFVK